MKNTYKIFALILVLFVSACKKDDPVAEVDQEELGTATLTFTEVSRELHNDHYHYDDIDGADVEEIKFTTQNNQLLPPVGAHVHLEVGKTYRLALKTTDFAGRESQQTFVSRADIHQAFILGAPQGTLSYEYADRDQENQKVNVGVTGYLTVLEESDSFTFQYIMRHLNPGVKSSVTANDWNNANYTKFTGANDLNLQFELHLIEEGHGH